MNKRQYLLITAHNAETKQTLVYDDLSGYRFTEDQRPMVKLVADKFASDLTDRTGEIWTARVKTYTKKH